MKIFTLALGDWSDEGHGRSKHFLVAFSADFDRSSIAENYAANCERFGFTLGNIFPQYETAFASVETVQNLIDAGLGNEDFPFALKDKLQEYAVKRDSRPVKEIYLDEPDFLQMSFFMLFSGMPENFAWYTIESEGYLIGEHDAIEPTAGYALYV